MGAAVHRQLHGTETIRKKGLRKQKGKTKKSFRFQNSCLKLRSAHYFSRKASIFPWGVCGGVIRVQAQS